MLRAVRLGREPTIWLIRAKYTDLRPPARVPSPWTMMRSFVLVIDYRWGSMGSNETATATTGGPLVIGVFDGDGAPSGPNKTIFVGADRLLDASRGRSGGW